MSDPDARFDWPIRTLPPGWSGRFEPLGGRLRGRDPFEKSGLPPEVAEETRRGLSTAFLAWTAGPGVEIEPAAQYWLAVCRKILTRSDASFVPSEFESWIAGVSAKKWQPQEILDAAFHRTPLESEATWAELHPTWEEPFWSMSQRRSPSSLCWLTPQAPLEPLAGWRRGDTERWVDFLWYPPPQVDGVSQPVVIEIDGSGHDHQRGVDQQRDQALHSGGVKVGRIPGDQLTSLWEARPKLGEMFDDADRTGRPEEAVLRLLHGPAVFGRLGMAILMGVELGHLRPGAPWRVAVVDPLGAAEEAAPELESLLRSIDELWNTAVLPDEIDWRFASEYSDGFESVDLVVRLEPFVAPHAELRRRSTSAEIVIRSAHLPRRLARHRPLTQLEQRTPVGLDDSVPLLVRLLQLIFKDLKQFREGQLESIHRALMRLDSIVLLPTGSGKSLIYQLSGLLQPGVVLIIDPIISLIDDQKRRLREDGVDHVLGLHSSSTHPDNMEVVSAGIGSGDYNFIFVTPERLQVKRFRRALEAGTERNPVALAVIDEAHCVSEWGHDFRPAYLRLGRNLRRLCRGLDDVSPPLLALTATAPPNVLRDLVSDLGLDDDKTAIREATSHDRPNLEYLISYNTSNLPTCLRTLVFESLGHIAKPSGIVFCPTVGGDLGILATTNLVRLSGVVEEHHVSMYSGKAPSGENKARWDRRKAEEAARFISGDSQVMVSTKAFGMGIDKPDIRFTLHRGIPSSIEAFAQETGRAGRDGGQAVCCLLTDETGTGALLDPTVELAERRGGWSEKRRGLRSDLATQFYFHYGSFGSAEADIQVAQEVLREIGTRPVASVAIPRGQRESSGSREKSKQREFALIRLMQVGVVDDYTIGADQFGVDLADFDGLSVDEKVLKAIDTLDPGRSEMHRQKVAVSPENLSERIGHHVQWVIETTYATVEPGRLRALEAMHRLAQSRADSDAIRAEILAYLSEGLLRRALEVLIVDADALDVEALLRVLKESYSTAEWVGASARQLEMTPSHPAALLGAAIGELYRADSQGDRFEQLCGQAFNSLAGYGVDARSGTSLFGFILERTRSANQSLLGSLWRAHPDRAQPGSELVGFEDDVIARAATGSYNSEELDEVLARRLRRSTAVLAQ